ncbi:uncharacterized protein LOC131672315 [Phymastichus coffea]|uniref:uncharacterized protein LOC131672315 n=1 Tax=Phymastichus coffea TaxID=108790 RepID=UPI00273C39AF|nr:uncharacterized protein LOC131672315 [Phymastichus coffea]
MVSDDGAGKPSKTFYIENNIIKGVKTKFDSSATGVGPLIMKVFNDKPNVVAQIEVETGKHTTYQEMKERSIRCALWLLKQNVGSGDVVTICTHNHLDSYVPCIATFFVGAIYNPWHHEVTLKTARHLMSLTRPKVIFACESAVEVLKEAARLEGVEAKMVVFEKHLELKTLKDIMRLQTNEEVETFKLPEIKDPSGIAMILFSSGTTGLPKGVAHSHRSLYRNTSSFGAMDDSKTLWYSSLYWISGTFCLLRSTLCAATRILHANFDAVETCKVIEKYKVDWFFVTPVMMIDFCKSKSLKKHKLDCLKVVLTGGSKVSRPILKEFKESLPNCAVAQAYGMTELGGVVSAQTKDCTKIESVGFVIPNMQLKIIDELSNKALGPNEVGEMCVKSDDKMLCYYRNPEATKATIDEDGWIHTGDRGYYAENGELFIVDRIKEVMKFRGHHVSAIEIEEVLLRHPDVIEAAVVPVPHDTDIERPMAFVKKIAASKVTEEELVELSSELGTYRKLWGGVKFIEEIPHTASGKVCRKELKEMAKLCSQ